MGMSDIPCVNNKQVLNNLLESIALEEAALANFINAEAEKIQQVAKSIECHSEAVNTDEVINFQKSVTVVMQLAIKMQMLLQFKLDKVLDAKLELDNTIGLSDDEPEISCTEVKKEESKKTIEIHNQEIRNTENYAREISNKEFCGENCLVEECC